MTNPPLTVESARSNPYGIDPSAEYLAQPESGVPLWSETMFFSFWDPDAEVGLYIHTGRVTDAVELWWAKVCVYLPGGVVVADRSFGHALDHRGPATGNLVIRCEEPLRRWSARFDGAGERTTSAAMGEALSGAGPAVPMRFELVMDAVSPVWDLHGALAIPERSWASAHHEQTHTGRGTLTVGEQHWDLDGVTFRDHSAGPRNLAPLGGDILLGVVFPQSGRSLQAVVMWDRDDEVELAAGWVHAAATGFTSLEDVQVDRLRDLRYGPRSLPVTFRHAGESHRVDLEVLHGVTMSMYEPNVNMNGAALDLADPLILTECPVRAVWAATGEVGYGNLERNQRLSRLERGGT